jgi:CRP-like cAMP-binding protein
MCPAILAEMETGGLERLAAVGTESVIAPGQTMIERDHPGVGLYLVVEGRVIVEAPEGTRELGQGALLGERALLSPHGVRTARVRAATDVRVLTVDRAKFEELCADDPGLAERLSSRASPT